jgi:acyl-CoA thioester hydrolase
MKANPPDSFYVDHKIRVRYAEVDRMDVVYNAYYVDWFAIGRTEYYRARGSSCREVEEEGYFIPLVDVYCRYHAPAHYDDLVIIRTWLKKAKRNFLHFGYQVINEDTGELLLEGETRHMVTDSDLKRSSLPDELFRLFTP